MNIYYKVLVIILICAALIAGVSVYLAKQVHAPSSAPAAPNAASTAVDTSGWNTYTNTRYGISFKYPSDWQKSNDPMNTVTPYVFFGDPLNGTTTYMMKVFAYANPKALSASDFVAQMLAEDKAQDASTAGTAPQVTPQFASQYATTAGSYPAYELDSVFEYDHNAEQIYVADGTSMIIFDFPVADANPNIASPASNNATAHAIVSTLQFTAAPATH